ncbi:fluoride efflux transporter CrcB [Clostridium magnum]|uniref:Fluoride-specific ion channel FluC n=1 Tax=Clostridium magnum DSM 2767 TaxID=1121326 RepID=A0A162SFP6_9CLOT|nr:fluoride efflux transporter CrcB [Clostridium magnum]KZL91187.1 putative fluoride ion transporter CrcB [Clostridium magnum DSM 2767]SHI17492.1 camphor resistance protein CrcB [Clostridium magnum DSM 2767]
MEFLLVGIGGIFGSLTRFSFGKYISDHCKSHFPVGTALINITGAILLGIISSANASRNLYLLFGDGFLGAYTTFSTFMYEGFNLFQGRDKLNGFTYILMSIILGLLGYNIGTKIGSLL